MVRRLAHLVALLAVLALSLIPLAPAQAHCAKAAAMAGHAMAMTADDLPMAEGYDAATSPAGMSCCPEADLPGGSCDTVCVQITALPGLFPAGEVAAVTAYRAASFHDPAGWRAPPAIEPPRFSLRS